MHQLLVHGYEHTLTKPRKRHKREMDAQGEVDRWLTFGVVDLSLCILAFLTFCECFSAASAARDCFCGCSGVRGSNASTSSLAGGKPASAAVISGLPNFWSSVEPFPKGQQNRGDRVRE